MMPTASTVTMWSPHRTGRRCVNTPAQTPNTGGSMYDKPTPRGNGTPWTRARDYKKVLMADPCCYCGEPATAADHIVPRNEGGEENWTNLTAACRSCNSSKWSQTLLAFLWQRQHGRNPGLYYMNDGRCGTWERGRGDRPDKRWVYR